MLWNHVRYDMIFYVTMESKDTYVAYDFTASAIHIIGLTQQKCKGKTAKCQNFCFCYNYCAYYDVAISIDLKMQIPLICIVDLMIHITRARTGSAANFYAL